MDIEVYKKNVKTNILAREYERLLAKEAELLALKETDPSLSALASEDLALLTIQKEALEEDMKRIVATEEEVLEYPSEIVLEVRAGAGGEEAALFAEELALMYQRYADKKKWEVRVLNKAESANFPFLFKIGR